MLVREAKLLNGAPRQYQALDETICTVLYALYKDLAKEFAFANRLNSAARQASAERAWFSIANFYKRCKRGEKQKGYPQFKKHCRSVEYKQSGWKLSNHGMSLTFTDGFGAGTFALYCDGEARQHILNSKINRVRVIRRADGYYAQFCLDVERKEKQEYIAILNENRTGVAGSPPPSLVLENFCSLIK